MAIKKMFVLPRTVHVDKHGHEVSEHDPNVAFLLGVKGSAVSMEQADLAGLTADPIPVSTVIAEPEGTTEAEVTEENAAVTAPEGTTEESEPQADSEVQTPSPEPEGTTETAAVEPEQSGRKDKSTKKR